MNSPYDFNSRYILPSFEERTAYGFKQQDPYGRLFQDRVVFLGTQVDSVSANDIISQFLVLESLDAQQDITFYINSPGGDMLGLTAILDTMEYIAPHVRTVCLGQASSAAAVLLAAGQPGKRAALPNSRIMIHQPATDGGPGQASDIEIQAVEVLRMRKWLEETLSARSNRTVEQVSKDIDRDKFLTASEALEYGLIDQILESRKNKNSKERIV